MKKSWVLEKEYLNALVAKQRAETNRTTSSTYTSRGPTNLGGRTRAMAVDLSDATSNTILAGGVSSGLFRTTNGGASWTKVSSNGEIHNVTAIAQDPRVGFQNIWYYLQLHFFELYNRYYDPAKIFFQICVHLCFF